MVEDGKSIQILEAAQEAGKLELVDEGDARFVNLFGAANWASEIDAPP